jgi:hypothetical protein
MAEEFELLAADWKNSHNHGDCFSGDKEAAA